jgi:GAF domain-containing protein
LSLFAKAARAFDTYERRFFSQVGLTVENALLYEEAARREREAGFLDRATRLFNSTLQLDTVFRLVTQMATEVLGESCTIFLKEEGKASLTPVATYHYDPVAREARWQSLRNHPIRIGDPASPVGQAAADGRPRLVKDARQERPLQQAEALRISSLIAVPIRVRGKILGAWPPASPVHRGSSPRRTCGWRWSWPSGRDSPSRTPDSTRKSGGCGSSWRP